MFTHRPHQASQFFPKLVEKIETYIPGSEPHAVKQFLEASPALKKINQILLGFDRHHAEYEGLLAMTNEIRSATTFSKILNVLERFDFENSNDPSIKKLGRFGVNTILFFGGFVNNTANFGYYALHLREETVAKMAELGYVNQLETTANRKP